MSATTRNLYGLMAEFETAEALAIATEKAYAAGYRKMDAYTPYPVEEVIHALGLKRNEVPFIVFLGGLIGCLVGFGMCYYFQVIDYPLVAGGKPLNSWPMYIPITFEVTVLFAALSAVFGMLALNGFPQPYHPVFNNPRFERASQDRFFLCIESADPLFDPQRTREFLQTLNPVEVAEVAQ
ncbi:MAG: membrane protein [Candidatus Sumerlaea sp.]|uniref:Alternative complex III subunit ActD n=1 Tax=Sumerlaea chitinivorans TaxID=2250252 RepID=A0A2Z4Y1R4_SUMC1|nr:alternative complex III subunit ActD [Candidatus Sumerlaea chitinivorans]MCX7963579.1 DUF3341 domain-containing protein [Candidatus Sumerlaea chitinivorans]GIX45295.1 MAG: membrane protein [Candidatus Sumerlaea sp.]